MKPIECHHPTSHDDSTFDADKFRREWHAAVREEGEAKIGEHEAFCKESQKLEHNGRSCFALWRKTEPSIVCHYDTTRQERNDTRLVEDFSGHIRKVAE